MLFDQWKYNKIINFVSALSISGKVKIDHKVGPENKTFKTENFVSRNNQENGWDGPYFVRKAHFKKWYKHEFSVFLTRWLKWPFWLDFISRLSLSGESEG